MFSCSNHKEYTVELYSEPKKPQPNYPHRIHKTKKKVKKKKPKPKETNFTTKTFAIFPGIHNT